MHLLNLLATGQRNLWYSVYSGRAHATEVYSELGDRLVRFGHICFGGLSPRKDYAMTRNAPTGRILKNDYPSLLMVMFIALVWILPILGAIFGFLPKRRGGGITDVDPTMLTVMIVVGVVVTLLCGWFASKRIADVKRIISSGPEVTGQIQSIDFYKDRGRVEYDYEYEGKSYHAGNAIWKNRETTALNDGDEITLILDLDNPSRAFIAALYT
jgi:hypothetical protein